MSSKRQRHVTDFFQSGAAKRRSATQPGSSDAEGKASPAGLHTHGSVRAEQHGVGGAGGAGAQHAAHAGDPGGSAGHHAASEEVQGAAAAAPAMTTAAAAACPSAACLLEPDMLVPRSGVEMHQAEASGAQMRCKEAEARPDFKAAGVSSTDARAAGASNADAPAAGSLSDAPAAGAGSRAATAASGGSSDAKAAGTGRAVTNGSSDAKAAGAAPDPKSGFAPRRVYLGSAADDCWLEEGRVPSHLAAQGEAFEELWDLHPPERARVRMMGKDLEVRARVGAGG